jgi:hypothetical protein
VYEKSESRRKKPINQKNGGRNMSKDGTNRGGPRPGSGRKPKAVAEKLANGNPGGRKLTVVDFGDEAENLVGTEMPPVKEYLGKEDKAEKTAASPALRISLKKPGNGCMSANVIS